MNSSFVSDQPLSYFCSTSQARFFITVGFAAVKALLLLPLSILVLHLGLQRWRQQRSFNSVSHSDVFTYHLAAMELFWAPGLVCYLCGDHFRNATAAYAGLLAFSVTFYGEFFFHSFTCVDRYLAVVHPIIYLRLKNVAGIRIRNISIASVWLFCLVIMRFETDVSGNNAIVFMLSSLGAFLMVVTFCNFSVLCALIRPGPGEGVIKIDPLKQRAFNTITAISCVLWLWFVALIVTSALSQSPLLSEDVGCILLAVASWFNLPASLVSPLLYLHRTRKVR
ncbi:hypothetical protein FQA47_022107 [Oryzias melastigma]|uniref:G-protein coupled receptors family 1 profile domain-containing protein n=1 Tax=Oryzias melastigma TaxID=30732 RepID=A0A834C0Y2_ORYME|nr:hypothetical protein FQA47_022107 [Oryzias melastigma]